MTSPFVVAEETRKRITTDHAVLRGIGRALVAAAEAAAYDERQRTLVEDILEQLCNEIRIHLEYEERVLVPILRVADAWGPVRVEELAKEHAEQRAVIASLLERGVECDIGELAGQISAFTERLERDIDEEEREMLSSEAMGDRIVVVDQIDG